MGARSRGRGNANYSPGAPAQTKRSFDSTIRFDSTTTRALAGSNTPVAVNDPSTTEGHTAQVAGLENLLNINKPRQQQPTTKHTGHSAAVPREHPTTHHPVRPDRGLAAKLTTFINKTNTTSGARRN